MMRTITDAEWRAFQDLPEGHYYSARAWFDGLLASRVAEPQGEPSGHDDGCADFYPEYGDPEGGVCKVCGDQVQGEPSAAQELGRRRVLAAAMALAGMGEGEFRRIPSSKRWRLKEQARAALRAARGVR